MRFPLFFLILSLCTLGALPAKAAPENQNPQMQASIVVSGFQGIVEEQLAGILHAERAIAAGADAQSGDWERVRSALVRLSDDLPTASAVWYAFPDGHYYTVEKGLVTQNLKDRTYFPTLLAGKDVEGDLVISKSTGQRSVIVATPVMLNGKTIAAIGVSVSANLLSQWVDQKIQLPADMYFYAINRDGKIALHRNIDRIFKHPEDIGDEALGPVFNTVLDKQRGVFSYTLNGAEISAVYQASTQSGWHFFIAKIHGR